MSVLTCIVISMNYTHPMTTNSITLYKNSIRAGFNYQKIVRRKNIDKRRILVNPQVNISIISPNNDSCIPSSQFISRGIFIISHGFKFSACIYI